MRNYRAGLAKWQTADPLGYPDGWNQLAYCRNLVSMGIDYIGGSAVINSFYDALNHYAYGLGAEAIIGTDVMIEATSTPEYQSVLEALSNKLSLVPYVQISGHFTDSGNFQWEQGLVLGRNVMSWSILVRWTATPWIYDVVGGYWYRELTGEGIMHLSTSDDWDFKVHDGDSLPRSVFGEILPAEIASLYSILVSSDIGEEYHMEGDALFWQTVYARQILE